MSSFDSVHHERVEGKLVMFDRMVFKGHLTRLMPDGAFKRFLASQGVLLKDFDEFVRHASAAVKAHAQGVAEDADRPYVYLQQTLTRRGGQSKEEFARSIAEADGVEEGLVCVLGCQELCATFTVRGNRHTHRLEVKRRNTKCTWFYFYFIDAEFGWMHVRLQSWFPFEIQVWINGRAWLARQLDAAGVGYTRHENAITTCDDLDFAQRLCDRFAHRKWPRVLGGFATRVNPHLATIAEAGFGGYYWVLDQAEIATDTLFRSRGALEGVLDDLLDHATLAVGADDVMRFLGRKLSPQFLGEVTTDRTRRREGVRIKHTMKRNSIKAYDKASVLRVETTINNPREFRTLRVTDTPQGRQRRWCPMRKGVADTWRYYQVGAKANDRYLDTLAQANLKREGVATLDALRRSRVRNGRRIPALDPLRADAAVFAAVLAGEHTITGFRNRDLAARLYPHPPPTRAEARRRCAHVSRLIAKLRGHGLLAKVKHCRLYRPTAYGLKVMTAALRLRHRDFPHAYAIAPA